jgi:hypothetical protein
MSVLAPELVKIGAEGYEHGFICVRPPCGKAPGHVRTSDLGVTRDGTVVHRPSGYAIGSVKRSESGGKFTASHAASGKETSHGKRIDAVAAIARSHNKSVKESEEPKADADAMPPTSLPAAAHEYAKPAMLGHVAAISSEAHLYTDEQAKAIDDRLTDLENELKQEKKRESRTDIAIESGTVIAAIGLSFFTNGASLVALAPILHDKLPDIGRVVAKSAVHVRTHGAPRMVAAAAVRARTALGKIPSMFRKAPQVPAVPAVKSDTSITPAAISHVAAAMVPSLTAGGLDPDDARSLALAMVSHAALALQAGKQPWDNDFITANSSAEDENVKKSAQTAALSTVHHPLGTHGLWGDKAAQLPAYIQSVAHALIRSGHDESSAISMAVAAVKRWASGRGKVSPEVRAAAAKAVAEWEKLKLEHSKSKLMARLRRQFYQKLMMR